jgi:hypothetical protein
MQGRVGGRVLLDSRWPSPAKRRRAFRRRAGTLCAHLCAFGFGSILSAGLSPAAVERPPQLIAIAFDNCTELERWNEVEQFLQAMNGGREPVHFTFFVSGTNFLSEQARYKYQGPRHRAGQARIDFGGSPGDVEARIGYINRLHAAGNEIASHAVGHFYGGRDGESWTVAEWTRELVSFNALFDNVASNNAIEGPGFGFRSDRIVGFRAPQLSVNPAMYEALQNLHYRYDTSSPGGDEADAWPQKNERGTWLFSLAQIGIAGMGTAHHPIAALSMDYNICANQMRARGRRGDCETALSDPAEIARLGDQTMETYLNYFRHNYMGNRAPMHIGHHFYEYQHGIYDKVLLAFAKAVCSLPETRCVSYSELADFIDALDPTSRSAYQRGEFSREGLQEPAIDDARRLRASER